MGSRDDGALAGRKVRYLLRVWYAMSGTELAYVRERAVLRRRMVFIGEDFMPIAEARTGSYRPTALLCNVLYWYRLSYYAPYYRPTALLCTVRYWYRLAWVLRRQYVVSGHTRLRMLDLAYRPIALSVLMQVCPYAYVPSTTTRLRASCAMSGTEIAYAATGTEIAYAAIGTEIAYAATGTEIAYAATSHCVALLKTEQVFAPISLRACYAMSGTDIA
eukprot:1013808-Rhodomonas_salina.4